MDSPRVLGDLRAAVEDAVVQRRGQGIDGRAVAQQPEIGERPRHHVQSPDHAEGAGH